MPLLLGLEAADPPPGRRHTVHDIEYLESVGLNRPPFVTKRFRLGDVRRAALLAAIVVAAPSAMPLGQATAQTRTYVTNDCLRVEIMPSYIMFTCADGGFYMTQGDWSTWHRYRAVGSAVFTGTTATPRALGARSMRCVGRSSSIAGPDAPTSVAAYSRGRRSRLTGGYWAATGIGRNCPAQRDGGAARVAERCPPTLLPGADIEEGALRR